MKKNSTVTNSKTSRLNKSESEKNQKKTKSEPKLFDLIKESSDFLGKINFSNETFGRLGDEELGRIENAVSKIPSLNNVKIKTKGEGVQDGFIIEKENKDKVFIKKDLVNSLSEVMLASNILYNMGLGPKVGFEKQGDGFVQFSKDLQFSEKSQDRKFHEAMTEMEQKYPVQNMQMYKIAKILKISDVSNESNTGIVKKNGVVKGKIFDFLPPSANTSDYVRTEQYYNEQFTIPPKGFKSSIIPQDNLTESQLMKDVKLDKDGKFMDKNQRKFANFEKKASFETVVKVSFNESVNRLKDLGATKEELEKLSKYKEEILARGKEEIAKMPKEEQKIISRK